MNFGTVKPVRDERVFGVSDNVRLLLSLSQRREHAKASQRQKDAGQDYKQAK
jgi:hypothetical protein